MNYWREAQRREAIALADAQHGITRCAFCSWKYRGQIETGKKLFRQHVERHRKVAA